MEFTVCSTTFWLLGDGSCFQSDLGKAAQRDADQQEEEQGCASRLPDLTPNRSSIDESLGEWGSRGIGGPFAYVLPKPALARDERPMIAVCGRESSEPQEEVARSVRALGGDAIACPAT